MVEEGKERTDEEEEHVRFSALVGLEAWSAEETDGVVDSGARLDGVARAPEILLGASQSVIFPS